MAMIPAMTTGMMDFMMSSGRITDMAAMPVPLFAVPYAAPNAKVGREIVIVHWFGAGRVANSGLSNLC